MLLVQYSIISWYQCQLLITKFNKLFSPFLAQYTSKSHTAHKLIAFYFSGFKHTSHFRFHASFLTFLYHTLLTFVSTRICWSFSFSKLSCVTCSLLHLIDSLHLPSNDSSFRTLSVTWSQLQIYPANGKTVTKDPDRYRCQENPNMAPMQWTYDDGDMWFALVNCFISIFSSGHVTDFSLPILILSHGWKKLTLYMSHDKLELIPAHAYW